MKWLNVLAFASLLAACGPAEKDVDSPSNNDATNNGATNNGATNNGATNNGATNNGAANNGATNNGSASVAVSCVSNLVSSNGNYYALDAEVTADGPRVSMIYQRAATPTSDPEEEIVLQDLVDGRLTALEFAFETQESVLLVERTDGDSYYRGTMTGQTEFESDIGVVCWERDVTIAAAYDATTGKCTNESGEEARNTIEWMHAARSGFGQCADFSGALNGEALGYPTFDKMDLRGAKFSNATIQFANLLDSQMEGVDFSGLTPGYALIGGSIDEYTILPEGDCESADGETFECQF